MTTSVLERKQQIGIMKAIGAKNSDIFFQFLIESGLLGFIGGLIHTEGVDTQLLPQLVEAILEVDPDLDCFLE